MIRDPSDGSVRQKVDLVQGTRSPASAPIGHQKPENDAPASGLRETSTKPENLARLEKSREWLANWRKAREA